MASFYAADVICPYYQQDDSMTCSITCEGALPGSTIRHHFENGSAFRKHLAKYCTKWEYERCPWAAVCALKWRSTAS